MAGRFNAASPTPYQRVRTRVAAACDRAGRDPNDIRLVAVSKTFPAARVRELIDCGHALFGENRVQEALAKISEVGSGATWHLVGHLQRNKVSQIVGAFELIHGVDSAALARVIDRKSAVAGLRQAILVQLNLSGESSKFGTTEAELGAILDEIGALPAVELRGLMTIPPPAASPEDSRRWFRRLRELRDREQQRMSRALPDLSMGMTDDFEVAIEEGATLIRVGRAIFGDRV
jgi:pyridoxal phosphate enzyme (YggS family)